MKTWKDVYKLPLITMGEALNLTNKDFLPNRIYDSSERSNFVFQFMIQDKIVIKELLEVINGNLKLKPKGSFIYNKNEGIIFFESEDKDWENKNVILIRGWGNLTGSGALNLPEEEAANIQDTFAEFICEKLNS